MPAQFQRDFFSVCADCCSSSRPIWVDPVKLNARTSGRSISRALSIGASPVTTWKTPGGSPASSASLANASAESGVSGAGLMIMLQPAARAAAALRVIMACGKFHGVIAAVTPMGCIRVLSWLPGK